MATRPQRELIAAAAVAVAGGAVAWLALRRPDIRVGALVAGVAGVAVLVVGVGLRWAWVLGVAGGLLGTAFVVTTVGEPVAAGPAVGFAILLYTALELADASRKMEAGFTPAPTRPSSWVSALPVRVVSAASAGVVAVVVLAGRGGLGLFVAGVVVAAAAVVMVPRVLRPSQRDP